MRKFRLSLLAVGLLLLAGSCKKNFLDINTDPNRATAGSVTPNLATGAQLANIAAQNASSWDMLNRWMGYWSASGSFSRATVEMSYNISTATGEGTWNNIYYTLGQLRTLDQNSANLGWKFYQGIAKIMSAHQWQTLVDLYGDVPFEKALDLSGNIRPAYTSGQTVYKALIPMIDEGIALIKAAGDDPNITTQDIMFQGKKVDWAKFGNTLKLRLLLHAVKTNTFDAAAEITKINTEGSGFLGNGLGAEVQPGYNNDKPNPFYAAHLHTTNGNEADDYNRANCFVLDAMKSLNDVRYQRIYRKTRTGFTGGVANNYRCTNYGALPLDDVNKDRTSGPGYGLLKMPIEDFTVPASSAAAAGASRPMWILTSVEAMFLIAEAKVRGWNITNPGGTDAEAYTAAVQESFRYLGYTTADADAYIAAASTPNPNPRVTFPAAGPQNDKLTTVIWQKYFALNGLQGNEVWTDWRRTGIVQPPLSLAPERGNNPIPRRLLYPSGEFSYNPDNVPKGVSAFTSKIFWDQ